MRKILTFLCSKEFLVKCLLDKLKADVVLIYNTPQVESREKALEMLKDVLNNNFTFKYHD